MERQLFFACHGMKLNLKLEVELPSCYGLIKFTIGTLANHCDGQFGIAFFQKMFVLKHFRL